MITITDLLHMTDREIKKYIKSCSITKIEDLTSSKIFIDKLGLSDVGTVGPKNNIELSDKLAVLKLYKRNQVNSIKVSIYYNYAPDQPNTPAAELGLRLYNDNNGKLGVVHWEESYNGWIYKLPNTYFSGNTEDLYIWKVTRYSDYKKPWDYLEALSEERKNLEPILTEATNALWNGDLDSLFLMYTGELLNQERNQFCPAVGYTTMISKASKEGLGLDDAFICYIADVLYDKQYSNGEFEKPKKILMSHLNAITDGSKTEITKYLDSMYGNKDTREYIKKILLANVDKEILKHAALRKLEKQKDKISGEYGLDPEYFKITI